MKSNFDRRGGSGPAPNSPVGRKVAREQSQISAIAEVNQQAAAQRLKTERLKNLRLAREAEVASAAPPPKARKPARKSAKAKAAAKVPPNDTAQTD